jgi:hypothetical protein
VQVHKGDFHGIEARGQNQWSAALEETKKACGISHVNSGNGYVLGNNSAGSDDHLIADRHRKDCGICSDTYTLPKPGRPPKVWLAGRASVGEAIVNEHRTMRNEAVVVNSDEFTDECVRLNPASLADRHSLLYLYKWTDEAAISNRAPIEIDWLDHRDVFTECYVDNPCVTDFRLWHEALA